MVAPFMRGYAPTSVPSDGNYHVGALMDDALRVLDAAGPTGRDVFIGHDWGALAAAGLAAMPDSPFTKAVIMSVPISAAFRPLGRVPQSGRLATKLSRQLLHSWYMIYFQLPWLPDRSTSWVVPKLWRDWSPGYRADEDLRHVDAAIGEPQRWHAALGYYRAAIRNSRPPRNTPGVTGRKRARTRRKRRTLPAARSARCCRAAHRRLRGTGLVIRISYSAAGVRDCPLCPPLSDNVANSYSSRQSRQRATLSLRAGHAVSGLSGRPVLRLPQPRMVARDERQ
jgi:pimeloyl-ACP methyl ester carboxylesterase